MPEAWTLKADMAYKHNEREFLEAESRLEGRIKGYRVTTYDVNGHPVRLNTIVPLNTDEGSKIFRILANKKPQWAYLRKDNIIYEFAGPEDAEKEISEARDRLDH